MNETQIVEPASEKGNKVKNKILEKVSRLRKLASIDNAIAGAATLGQKLGEAFIVYGIVNEALFDHITKGPINTELNNYFVGAVLVAGGEVLRRNYERVAKREDRIANHLEAELILDALKEKKK